MRGIPGRISVDWVAGWRGIRRVLYQKRWHQALANSGFSQAALAGFTEFTRGINTGHICPESDANAEQWRGTTPLHEVISELVRSRIDGK